MASLQALQRGRTSLCVAHRLSTAAQCDQARYTQRPPGAGGLLVPYRCAVPLESCLYLFVLDLQMSVLCCNRSYAVSRACVM